MSDTPRTDKAPWTFTEADLNSRKKQRWVKIEFARELERENAALKTALDHQMTYQRELRADKARLDWLLNRGVAWRDCYDGHWQATEWLYMRQNGRGTIDAAMGEGK